MTQAMTAPLVFPSDTLDRDDFIVALGCEPARDWQQVGEAQVAAQASESAKRFFEFQKAERDALSADALTTAFLPVLVVKHALKVAGQLVPYVDEVKTMKGVVVERLALRERALSLWHADIVLNYATQGLSAERQLADEGKPLRQSIFDWGQAMVKWEVFTEAEFKRLTKGTSRDDLATDLLFIGERCVDKWAKLENRVTFTLADAQRALVVGTELISALATQAAAAEPGAVTADKAKNDHRRAFTLLAQSVDEFRLALAWLHRDDRGFDVDAVCPSIYSVKKNPTPKPKTAPDAT